MRLSERAKYQLRNAPNRLRGLKAEACRLAQVGVLAELEATVIRADGTRVALGILGRRMVTDAGVQFLADACMGTTEAENLNWHDSGTSTTAEAQNQTGLLAAAGPARVSGTQSKPAANQYRTVATITYSGTLSIAEHGVFSSSTSGTLLDRTQFAAIPVGSGDSIQFTYTLTFTAGG